MSEPRKLSADPSYRAFIRDRDLALEELHRKAQLRITDALNGALNKVSDIAMSMMARSVGTQAAFIKPELDAFDRQVDQALASALPEIMAAQSDLDRRARLLAHAGETEAIGRALRKQLEYKIAITEPTYEEWQARIGVAALALDRIRREIVDAYQSARVHDLSFTDGMARVEAAFPKLKRYRRGPKFLKAVPNREAAGDPKQAYSFGILDEQEWEQILDEFLKAHVPTSRAPKAVFDVPDEDGQLVEWYGWEIEQEMTDSFVKSVRSGQLDAAKEQGIKDFVWLAVLDDRTDECCEWRDGLTSGQIEARLNTDKKADDCQVTVPPAHFNCRCTLAPVTDETPSDEPYNPQTFEEWLNTG